MDGKLIKKLEDIKKIKYDFTNINCLDFAYELIPNIGDLDSRNRDELVYPVLAHLLHDDVLENKELDKIAQLLITDDYLFYDMDNTIPFSVVKRTFTLLQLVILVYKHNTKNVLEHSTFENIVDKFYQYYQLETEYRGYVEEIGWLHSIAHSSDLFEQIFKNQTITEKQVVQALNMIKEKFMIKHYQYVSDEQERTATAFFALITNQNIKEITIKDWIQSFKDYERIHEYPEAYHFKLNIQRLLKAIYFRFIDEDKYQYITNTIKETLKEIK